jgi:uncharacterized repeat protein (TIGR03803 family)
MKKHHFIWIVLICLSTGSLVAQFDVIHNFKKSNGSEPTGSLVYCNGLFYGLAQYGGVFNLGCIFSIRPDGSCYVDEYDFKGENGAVPRRSLTLSGSMLYGVTSSGGENIYGNIFSFDPQNNKYTNIFDLNGIQGKYLYCNVTVCRRTIYGMTQAGGKYLKGNIFAIDTDGNQYEDLHDFADTDGLGDGGFGSLTLIGNKLFGMTYNGGAHNDGYIFSVDTDGRKFLELFDFNGKNGKGPQGDLAVYGNKFYGMACKGGASNYGCLFSIDTNGRTGYKDIHDFNLKDGGQPYDNVILVANNLFGMTADGGKYGQGLIFSADTSGRGYTDLTDFNGANTPAGKYPYGGLTFLKNKIYGMTEYGGINNLGVIFRLDTTIKPGVLTFTMK